MRFINVNWIIFFFTLISFGFSDEKDNIKISPTLISEENVSVELVLGSGFIVTGSILAVTQGGEHTNFIVGKVELLKGNRTQFNNFLAVQKNNDDRSKYLFLSFKTILSSRPLEFNDFINDSGWMFFVKKCPDRDDRLCLLTVDPFDSIMTNSPELRRDIKIFIEKKN